MSNYKHNLRLLTGPERKSLKTTKYLAFLLHGWGSDGNDLIQLSDYWSDEFPNMTFCSPNAPEICSGNPQGRQWFDIMSQDVDLRTQGLYNAYQDLESYITDKLNFYNVEKSNYFLIGFSQGTMLALHAAIRRECLGIIGYSGAFINKNLPDNIKKNDIILLHGKNDTIVPLEKMESAYQKLQDKSSFIECFTYDNLEHSINEKGIEQAKIFMKDRI